MNNSIQARQYCPACKTTICTICNSTTEGKHFALALCKDDSPCVWAVEDIEREACPNCASPEAPGIGDS